MRFHHVGNLRRQKSEFGNSLMEIDLGWLRCVASTQ